MDKLGCTFAASLEIAEITESNSILVLTLIDEKKLYTRTCYLPKELSPIQSFVSTTLTESQVTALLLAVRRYLAECKAVSLLNYCENTRFLLMTKLEKKGFLKNEITPSLDYLENQGLLSDLRFANSYLRSRIKTKNEGRKLLKAKLIAKGVSSNLVEKALLENFPLEVELEACKKSLIKLKAKFSESEKVYQGLMKLGFSSTTIRKTMEAIEDEAF